MTDKYQSIKIKLSLSKQLSIIAVLLDKPKQQLIENVLFDYSKPYMKEIKRLRFQ